MIPRVAAGVLLACVLGAAGSAAADPLFTVVDPVEDVDVKLVAGGDVLHLVYFATWCPECVGELPALSEFEDRFRDRPYRLVVVAVNTRQTRERLLRFAASGRAPGRLVFDRQGRAAAALSVDGLPTHVVIGRDGKELARGSSLETVRAPLEQALLAGRTR